MTCAPEPPDVDPPRTDVRPAHVVQIHGAGPHLDGLTENVVRLGAALGSESRVVVYDAARAVPLLAKTGNLMGRSVFGYRPQDLAKVAYDWEVPHRIADDVESALASRGRDQVVVVVGHSMGAASAVHAVEILAERGLGVDDLLLLDRMFFEWRLTAFFGLVDRRVRLTERGARRVGVLHEVTVPKAQLTARERIWLATPSGGSRPIPEGLESYPGRLIRDEAPEGYGHATVPWWTRPYERIAARWRAAPERGLVPINAASGVAS